MTEPWMSDALCATTDPEAFFPDADQSAARAKSICARCDVVEACLEYALATNQQYGIWGNKSVRERAKIKRDAA